AVQLLTGTAVDRLGTPVVSAILTYVTSDPNVVSVDDRGNVQSRGNGAARISVTSDGVTTDLHTTVQQRPTRVGFPRDTIRFVALGDTATISATALDSLGSPVSGGISGLHVLDTVVALADLSTVRASANGATIVEVEIGGIAG